MKFSTFRLAQVPSIALAALLQVLPLVRAALPVTEGAAKVIVILLRWVAGAAAALGGVQAVSGASTVITNPLTASATNGQAFSLRLTTAPDQAHYWTATGLPTGIILSGISGGAYWILTGTPTVSGAFSVFLTAKDQSTSGADRTCTATLALTVVDGSPPNTPPSVSSQPTNITVNAGKTATFSVGVTGSSPLSYQWRKNGGDLATRTNSILALGSVTGGDAGGYDVVVTNAFGSVTSSVATLTVNVPPSISTQPQSQTVLSGVDVLFSVTAGGTVPLHYFWRKGSSVIVSGTNSTLTLSNVQSSAGGNYSVIVSNVAGTVTSATAVLTVNQAPFISTQPSNQTVLAGQAAVFAVAAGGTAPLVYQWSLDGLPLPGATNATLTVSPAQPGDAGGYSVGITNALGAITSVVATLTVNVPPDSTRPTIAFTAPTATVLSVTSNSFRLTGTAKDDVGLASVQIFPAGGAPMIATGTTNWSAVVNLSAGSNVFQAASFDFANNASVTNTRTIICVVTSPLSLTKQGLGTVNGATNGQWLQVGHRYTLTAVPAAGYVFSNWAGGLSATANPLIFLMQSNLALSANFVTNPFVGPAGSYNGLYLVGTNLENGSAGGLALLVKPNGTFSAKIVSGKTKYSWVGRFDLEGHATNQIVRKGTNNLTVGLSLDLHGAGTLMGSVTDGAWTADLLAYRAAYNTKLNPATNLARLYTVLIPGAADDSSAPAGTGLGAVKVDLAGVSTVAGSLADGSKFALKAGLSSAGDWAIYLPCYKGVGAIFGWLSLAPSNHPAIAGTLHWLRPAGLANKYYTNGFLLDAAVAGSVYRAPGTNHVLNLPTIQLVVEGGNQPSMTNTLALGPGNRCTNAGPHACSLALKTANGTFTGSILPVVGAKAVKFQGALLQDQLLGAGYFLGTNRIGNISVAP